MAREELQGRTPVDTAAGFKTTKVYISSPEQYQNFLQRSRGTLDQEAKVAWEKVLRTGYTPEMPLEILLAASVVCDKKCPYCYLQNPKYHEFVQKPALLSRNSLLTPGHFQKLFAEIDSWNLTSPKDKIYGIKFSPGGEPALNKNIGDYLRTIRRSTFDYSIFFMTAIPKEAIMPIEEWRQLCQDLVESRVNIVSVSAEGWDKLSYEKLRLNGDFGDFLQRLEILRETRDKLSPDGAPGIRWQTIISPYLAQTANLQEAIKKIEPFIDTISINGEVDYVGEDDISEIVRLPNFSCYEPNARMMFYPGIDTQGKPSLVAAQCVMDEMLQNAIGHFPENSLREIWHGEPINAVRKAHSQQEGWKKFPRTCGVCVLPQEFVQTEQIKVNFRGERVQFRPFRYVGRKSETAALRAVS